MAFGPPASPDRLAEARRLLGVDAGAGPQATRGAFRRAVKAAHPDRPGGDAVRLRDLIDAYRRIQADERIIDAAPEPPAARPVVCITPLQAIHGAVLKVAGAGLVFSPPGTRCGDRRGSATVLIRPSDGLCVVGDDLYMVHPIPARLAMDGGRIEIPTHAGPRAAWLVARALQARLRLKGLGLPARGERPQGDLYVRLVPDPALAGEAEERLVRFTRAWATESAAPLAAAAVAA